MGRPARMHACKQYRRMHARLAPRAGLVPACCNAEAAASRQAPRQGRTVVLNGACVSVAAVSWRWGRRRHYHGRGAGREVG